MELTDRYNQIKESYSASSERPFLCEETIFLDLNNYQSYIELYVKLLDDGLDLIVNSNWNLLQWCIRYGDYNQCKKLINMYDKDTVMSIDLDIDTEIVSLLNSRIDIRLILPPNDNLISISSIMNIISNSIIASDDIIEVPLCNESLLLRRYMELLSIPYVLIYDSEYGDYITERYRLNRSFTRSELYMLDSDELTHILISAINEGRSKLAASICNKESQSIGPSDINTIIGFNTLFELLQSGVNITVDDMPEVFTKFINYDYDLEYCSRPILNNYWKSINIENVTNVRALDHMLIRCSNMPTCDHILESLSNIDDPDGYISKLQLCSRMCRYNSSIKKDNVLNVIMMLDRYANEEYRDRVNNSIMSLLIDLIDGNLINIDDYNNEHPYINFLSRLH